MGAVLFKAVSVLLARFSILWKLEQKSCSKSFVLLLETPLKPSWAVRGVAQCFESNKFSFRF